MPLEKRQLLTTTTFDVTNVTVIEGNPGNPIRYAVFNVTLTSGNVNATNNVSYTTLDGGAKAGADYVGVSGTLTVPAGRSPGTQSISVPIISNLAVEDDRVFFMRISYATSDSGVVTEYSQALIQDDDGPHHPGGGFMIPGPPLPPSSPPAAPGNLRIDNLWRDKLDLRWDDRSTNETSFAVYLSDDKYAAQGFGFHVVSRTAANQTRIRLTGLVPNREYWVYVAAENAGGSVKSNRIHLRMKP